MSDPAASNTEPEVPSAPGFTPPSTGYESSAPQPQYGPPQQPAQPQWGPPQQDGQPQWGPPQQDGQPQWGPPQQFGAVPQQQYTPAPRGTGLNAPGARAILIGLAMIVGGVVITVVTSLLSPGHFYVFWGLSIIGLVTVIRGIVAFAKGR